jgi:hypothetical protein
VRTLIVEANEVGASPRRAHLTVVLIGRRPAIRVADRVFVLFNPPAATRLLEMLEGFEPLSRVVGQCRVGTSRSWRAEVVPSHPPDRTTLAVTADEFQFELHLATEVLPRFTKSLRASVRWPLRPLNEVLPESAHRARR